MGKRKIERERESGQKYLQFDRNATRAKFKYILSAKFQINLSTEFYI